MSAASPVRPAKPVPHGPIPLAASDRGAVAELVKQGRRLEAGGNWDEAEAKVRLAVSIAPDRAAGHQALGLHLAKRGRLPEALASLDRAVACEPDSASAHNNLGAVAARSGEFQRAATAFRAAAGLRPDWVEARLNLGMACLQSERYADAAAAYRAADELAPGRADVAYRLSLALARLGQLSEAVEYSRRAAEGSSASAEIGRHHGNLLRRLGRNEEAVAALRQAVGVQPGDPALRMDFAIALHEAGRTSEALEAFGEATAAAPDSADNHTNLGVALAEAGYLSEAVASHERAVGLNPDSAPAHNNLAITLIKLGRPDDAMRHYDRAIALKPDYADARTNRARAILAAGPSEEGWREYEWRWKGDKIPPRDRACPAWHGRPLPAGSRLLVHAEQGLGDTIQFVRLVARARERAAATVVFECPAGLHPLLAGVPGIDGFASPEGEPPACAAHVPLLTLPALLGLTPEDLPGIAFPYLRPHEDRVREWKARVHEAAPDARLRVGIAWQGNPRFKADRARSIPLAHFGPLAGVRGLQLIGLQKGHGEEQVADVPGLGVVSLGSDLDGAGGFLDTLAVLPTLDLVVTADTAVAHLAGAAGVPTWLALPFAADWRWGKERTDSPWYPTLRLFRQPRPGDWAAVFRGMADELARDRPPAADLIGGVIETLRRRATDARAAGRNGEAADLLRDANRLRPDDPDLTHELALALARNKCRYEAEVCFRRCLARGPAAEACNNLGILLEETDRADKACDLFRQSLALKPGSPETHSNLGVALAARGEFEPAVASYAESIRLKPDNPAAYNNLGNALRNLGLPWQSIEALDRAIAQSGEYAEAHNNKGIALVLLGRVEEALACYARALELKPDYAEAHLNRALSLLATGRYEDGWREYEWRWGCNGTGPRELPGPAWDGDEVAGGPLLLTAEQGLGDTIQFARLVPLVARRARAAVVLECQPSLIPLMRSFPGLDQIVPAGRPVPACGAHAPLMSVPGLLELTEADLPAVTSPYLHPEPDRVERWRERLHAAVPGPGLKVGIGWQGNPKFKADRFRSIPLAHFGPLATVPGVRLVSLQKGHGEEQLDRLPPWFPVAALGPDVDRDGAFLDTLAILPSLDLVVTSDTALAHVAGAAGVPTWLALPFAADWRWGKGRADCPWYPSVRLFRQPEPGDWATPFRQMADELARRQKATRDESRDSAAAAVADFGRRGSAEVRVGRYEAAVELFKQGLRVRPTHPDLLHNLGVAWAKQGTLPVAQAYFREAVRVKPAATETHNNLGLSYIQQDRLPEAEACFRAALKEVPDHPDALNHLGVTFANREQWDEAATWYRAAVRAKPDSAEAHNNLGNALRRLKQPEEAATHLQTAADLKPDSADIWNNLGIVRGQLGRHADAVACFEKALGLDPAHADALNNLGVTLADLGREAEGIDCLERAVRLKPDFPEAHKNLGLTRLIRGDYRGGWPEYEWRWKAKDNPPRTYAVPAWDGRPVAGGPLLLYAEQGLGDTIQFLRLAAAAGTRANAPVVVECQPPLAALLKGFPGVQQVVAAGDPLPTFAAHAPMMSVPGLLDLGEADLPAIGFPYLTADPSRAAAWKGRLADLLPGPGLKVGIGWQGNPKYAGDRHRSVPLVYFTALHRVAGVRLVSLQHGHGVEQLDRLPPWFPVATLGPDVDRDGAFLDTLAVLQSLDLVVTSDTALAHVAGAAGVPTWLALPAAADWRWGRRRADCPWYPSLRLFRQPEPGNWTAVFEEIAHALAAHAGTGGALTAEIAHGELFDKVSILEIKAERIDDPAKRANVLRELAALKHRRPPTPAGRDPELQKSLARLKEVNELLWIVEDDLRECERAGRFDEAFVQLARMVYQLNDERAAVKRAVNDLFGSPIVEEKSYAPYPTTG